MLKEIDPRRLEIQLSGSQAHISLRYGMPSKKIPQKNLYLTFGERATGLVIVLLESRME